MKVCALTMVYRDYWALSQWYRHYGNALGHRNLFVVAHGHDPEIARICPEASVITVPRDDLKWFDRKRSGLLNGIQSGLGHVFDWVIRTDADELICLDPKLHDSFSDFFSKCSSDAVFALGFELIQRENDADAEDTQSVFACRDGAVFSGAYSKAFAVSDDAQLFLHGVRLTRNNLRSYPFQFPQGVYLAHIKYANVDALAQSNEHRAYMARMEKPGMPGPQWKEAQAYAEERFDWIETFPELPWAAAEAKAYDTIAGAPVRKEKGRVLKAASVNFDFRTTLPAWFRHQ